MNIKSNRGIIPAIYLVAGAVALVVALWPSWHLPAFLQKKPQTAQLTQAQTDLAAAKIALAKAEADLAVAQAKEKEAKDAQLAYSQQMAAGVVSSLAKAPISPEVTLAKGFADRAVNGMTLALGKLPADQQAEITLLVQQALSSKQAEVDAANEALKAKDTRLAQETTARKAAEASIPPLKASVEAANAQVGAKTALVTEKTAEVSQWASAKAESDAKAGSLGTYAENLWRILLIVAIGYIVIHIVFPSLAAEFPAATWLSGIYRFFTSLTSAHTITVPSPTVSNVPTQPTIK